MLLIIGHSVLGVSFNNLKFSSEIDTNSLHAINNTIQYREQNLSIKIDKNHTVHDQTNGVVIVSDDNIYLKSDRQIRIVTDVHDIDCENILINEKPLNQIIHHIVSTSVIDLVNQKMNPLWGKKLSIVGDSEALYIGNFDYGNLIAKRNNMSVINNARGNSTLVYRDNDSLLPNYRRWIPDDSDYIIVHIGFKDGDYWDESAPDNSTETTTFKGAWNTFLQGLVQYYPNAKKAIILPYYWETGQGRDTRVQWMKTRCNFYQLEYFDSVIELDFSPTTHPQCWTIEPTTGLKSKVHLSILGHERASYVYEQFLKTRVQFSK